MKITIAGYGFVGKAHDVILNNYYDLEIVDPAYEEFSNTVSEDTNGVIICVATPSRKYGECEMKHVFEAVESCPDVPILIKSTITVEGWKMIKDTFPNKMISYSPEFLRQDTWMEDAKNLKHILIGGASTQFWSDVFIKAIGNPTIELVDPAELVAAKAMRNSFLALKVSFFNQVYDFCKAHELDFEQVRKAITKDNRIGESHSKVTQQRGFGGHCFPKDTMATIRSAQSYGARLSVLEEAINYNQSIRKE